MLNHEISSRSRGSLHVAELAERTGVTPATVRYYARVGLLNPGREPDNGYRCFSAEDLHRVEFIRRAQALGLSIGDIKTVLETVDRGDVPCRQVRDLVEQRLQYIRVQLKELHETELRISKALQEWQDMSDTRPEAGEYCPLIERLSVTGESLGNSVGLLSVQSS